MGKVYWAGLGAPTKLLDLSTDHGPETQENSQDVASPDFDLSASATITISANGSVIRVSGNSTFLGGLSGDISANGVLKLLEGGSFTGKNDLHIEGTLQFSLDIFKNGFALSAEANATISGHGTITAGLSSDGNLTASGGTLDVEGHAAFNNSTLSGSGTIKLDHNNFSFGSSKITVSNLVSSDSTLTFSDAVSDAKTFLETDSTLDFLSNGSLTLSGTTTLNGGKVIGGTLTLQGTSTSNGFNIQGSGSLVVGESLDLTGTLSLGAQVAHSNGTLDVKAGGVIDLSDGSSIKLAAAGDLGTVSNAGTLEKVDGIGHATVDVSVDNNGGAIHAYSGTLEFAKAITGVGTIDIDGGTLKLDQKPSATQSITFGDHGGTLALEASGKYANTIVGFGADATFDLTTMSNAKVDSVKELSGGTNSTLVVSNGKQTDTFTLAGNFSASDFVTHRDATGTGTSVTYKNAVAADAAAPTWASVFATNAGTTTASPHSSVDAGDSGLTQALFDAAFDPGSGLAHSTYAAGTHGSSDLVAAPDGTKSAHHS